MVFCSYTGIQQVRRFHVTMGHGGILEALLDVLPQFGIPPTDGTLFLTDGINSLTIPGCRIDRANIAYSMSGHVVRVKILGPTWRWKLAGIDGTYNIPRSDNTIEPGTERTPQELASLLFDAMKVPRYDVSGLPNNTRPFVNWQGSLAYSELTKLCQDNGCDFGHDVHNVIARIWRVGFGATLPSGGEQTIDYGVNLSEAPDRIKAYCSPTEYQSKLLCEWVMPDSNGVWKLGEDVDYAPLNGWDGCDPNDPLPAETNQVTRALAKRWMYRAWRAKSQADGSHNVLGFGSVRGMEDILPLYDRLVESYDDAGVFKMSAYLEGTIEVGGDPLPLRNSEDHERIDVGHTLDGERGIFVSDLPLTKLNDLNQQVKADVYAVCSYNVRHQVTFQPAYHTLSEQIANNGTGELPLHVPALARQIIGVYNKANLQRVLDNVESVNNQLRNHIFALATEFQPVASATKQYRGLIPIIMDGAIRQVSYRGACMGPGKGCYTFAAWNTECEPGVDVRPHRRRRAELDRIRVIKDQAEYDQRKLRQQGVLR